MHVSVYFPLFICSEQHGIFGKTILYDDAVQGMAFQKRLVLRSGSSQVPMYTAQSYAMMMRMMRMMIR